MGVISWIILGLIAGWLVGLFVNKPTSGLLQNLALGVVGAVVGGFLASAVFGTGDHRHQHLEHHRRRRRRRHRRLGLQQVRQPRLTRQRSGGAPARRRRLVSLPGLDPASDRAVGHGSRASRTAPGS